VRHLCSEQTCQAEPVAPGGALAVPLRARPPLGRRCKVRQLERSPIFGGAHGRLSPPTGRARPSGACQTCLAEAGAPVGALSVPLRARLLCPAPFPFLSSVCVCLLLQDLVQSCLWGGGYRVTRRYYWVFFSHLAPQVWKSELRERIGTEGKGPGNFSSQSRAAVLASSQSRAAVLACLRVHAQLTPAVRRCRHAPQPAKGNAEHAS
jgi:hypothetical protein